MDYRIHHSSDGHDSLLCFYEQRWTFTVEYIAAIATETNRKAIFLSLKLGVICTLVCLVLSYPLAMILNNMQIKNQGLLCLFSCSDVDELYAPYSGMETSAIQKTV